MSIWKCHAPTMPNAKSLLDMQVQNATLWRCEWKSTSYGADAPYEDANINFYASDASVCDGSINQLFKISNLKPHFSWIIFFQFWWDFKCSMQNSCPKITCLILILKILNFNDHYQEFYKHVHIVVFKVGWIIWPSKSGFFPWIFQNLTKRSKGWCVLAHELFDYQVLWKDSIFEEFKQT